MKTFIESLQITTNLKILKEFFFLMSERGFDPNDFVEWYTTDGINMQNKGILTEASEEWLEGKIANWFRDYAGQKGLGKATNAMGTAVGGVAGAGYDATKGLMGAAYDNTKAAANRLGGTFQAVTGWGNQPQQNQPQQNQPPQSQNQPSQSQNQPQNQPQSPEPSYFTHAKNAATAIDALSKRMSKSKSLSQKLGGTSFQSAVVNLLHMLRNPSNIVQSNPTNNATNIESPSLESNGFERFTRKIALRNEIKSGLKTLQEHNINPVEFVKWYIEEGQHLNEGLFDGVKDWFGRQWANAKGAWNQWGKAGDEYQNQKNQQRDTEAIQQALYALDELEKGMNGVQSTEDFASILKQVQNVLNKSNQPEPEENQAGPGPEENQPGPGPEPEENQPGPEPEENQPGPVWKDQIHDLNPSDPASVHQAIQLFNSLPDDQKKEIDDNARKIWVKKGKPSQDQAGADQDKALAMKIMAIGRSHEFNDMASESVFKMPGFYEYLKRKA